MPWVACRICSKELYIRPNKEKIGWGKYCSVTCCSKGRLKGKEYPCKNCGKIVVRTPGELRKSRSGHFFCNRGCSMSWKNSQLRSGVNHYLWNGGTSTYRRLKEQNSDKIVCEHCGFKDKRALVVHHIDHNRQNNELENLQWLCRNCHFLVHEGKTV